MLCATVSLIAYHLIRLIPSRRDGSGARGFVLGQLIGAAFVIYDVRPRAVRAPCHLASVAATVALWFTARGRIALFLLSTFKFVSPFKHLNTASGLQGVVYLRSSSKWRRLN